MRRDLTSMINARHDLIVVGGGVHGACVAWEAVRRGLRVALVEAADFGHATSSNSLRTFHGGIRYLQQLDLWRMRESIRERREWLRLAPHLVRPMRFVLATTGHGLRGPEVLRLALYANDLMGLDRNVGVAADRYLPGGELWNRERAAQALAGTAVEGRNGAAAWYDAVCMSPERLQIAILKAAFNAGAHIANYVKALEPVRMAGAVRGICARDVLTGNDFELHARAVINAAGPWVDEWLPSHSPQPQRRLFRASKAFNLVTRPLPFADAVGLACPRRERTGIADKGTNTYFVIPWNGRSLIGTRHLRCEPELRSAAITAAEVQEFLADLNRALGTHRISAADVTGVFCGLLPERAGADGTEVMLEKTARIVDHAAQGMSRLYSIVGVKWTTARSVAERAVITACRPLLPPRKPTPRTLGSARATRTSLMRARTLALDAETIEHLEQMYGATIDRILELIEDVPALAERVVPDSPVSQAQIVYAVRAEVAYRLTDVIRRRTLLYLSDAIDVPGLRTCATLMGRELGWSSAETARQIEDAAEELHMFHHGTGVRSRVSEASSQRSVPERDFTHSAADVRG